MKQWFSLMILAALVIGRPVFSAEPQTTGLRIAKEEVAEWNRAVAHNSIDEILSLYARDALLMQPNGVAVRGSDGIRQFWEVLLNQPSGTYRFSLDDVRVEPDGTIISRILVNDIKYLGVPERTMKYRYEGVLYHVLKRQADGNWKAEVQRWSSRRGG